MKNPRWKAEKGKNLFLIFDGINVT